MTEAHRCEQLAQGCYAALSQWKSNPWPIDWNHTWAFHWHKRKRPWTIKSNLQRVPWLFHVNYTDPVLRWLTIITKRNVYLLQISQARDTYQDSVEILGKSQELYYNLCLYIQKYLYNTIIIMLTSNDKPISIQKLNIQSLSPVWVYALLRPTKSIIKSWTNKYQLDNTIELMTHNRVNVASFNVNIMLCYNTSL